ncbi:hypothetical protein [Chlorogloeopsis fritschii]|nr:hypothetical protein [Chlorogloeopsis fritschii]
MTANIIDFLQRSRSSLITTTDGHRWTQILSGFIGVHLWSICLKIE